MRELLVKNPPAFPLAGECRTWRV